MSNVVACTLFGGVAGSPVADVSAMGAVMIPMMKREGYHADYAVNVTTHAALVGALMPTSHNMIIYALAASGKASIGALILAGLLPALLLTLCNLGAAYYVAVKRGYPALAIPPAGEVVWRAVGGGGAGPAGGGDHPGRHPLRRLHRHGIGLGRGASTRSCSPSSSTARMTWEQFLKAAAKAVQDHRRGAAADRRLDHVPVSDGPLRGGRPDRRGHGQHLDQAVGDLPSGQPDPVHPRHLPGHGGTILICTPIFLPIARSTAWARCSSAW